MNIICKYNVSLSPSKLEMWFWFLASFSTSEIWQTVCLTMIAPFHNVFPLAMSNLNNVNQLIHYNYQLTEPCRVIFHNYCCYIKHGGIITNLTLRNLQNATTRMYHVRYLKYGSKDITFYVEKPTAHRTVCHNFSLVRDKLLGTPVFVKLVYCHNSWQWIMKYQKFTEWRPFVIARQWKKSLLGTFDLWWAYIVLNETILLFRYIWSSFCLSK